MTTFPRFVAPAAAVRTLFNGFEATLGATLLAAGLLLASAHAVPAHEFKVGDIEIDHPWSRATPGGAKVAGGFMVIKNEGAAPDRLVAVSSDISARSEIHEMGMANGVMTMRPLPDGLPVPADGSVALKPGSYHLMFIDLKHPVKQGEPFKATLTFEKAGTVEVTFMVEAIGAKADSQHDGHMSMPQ